MRKIILIMLINFVSINASQEEYKYVVDTIDYLQKKYPSLVSKMLIGKSVEKRDLTVLRISASKNNDLPAIYLGASIHGHEYSHFALLEALKGFLQKREQRDIASLLKSTIIWVQPMVNPDGVVRGSRKNATGVDLNRNFGYHWGENWGTRFKNVRQKKSSYYIGDSAFSEPESQAVRDFLLQRKSITIYADYHMSADMIFTAFGVIDHPINKEYKWLYQTLHHVMDRYSQYPKRHQIIDVVRNGSGYTIDWTYGVLGIYSFTFELSYQRKKFDIVENSIIYFLQECSKIKRRKPFVVESVEGK
ncbi:M14 family metallopeptidase [Candidatus Uabimicrobium sp. HlEnr_7]|uniref:M14 family metallopeptidase n=1 Tax=Candidatus Uabimicrobium helgolandensis TaxID=3095367 RepID=UPI00355800E5